MPIIPAPAIEPIPFLVSGKYYVGGAPFYGFATTGASGFANGDQFAIPFWVRRTTTFDRIAIQVTTASAANGVARLGIYYDGGGGPSTVLLDAGTVEVATTGSKTITISQALSPGLWWLAFVPQGAPATEAILAGTSDLDTPEVFYDSPSTGCAGSFYIAGQTGALATWGTLARDAVKPKIWLRAA